ncbi:hypothetical protein HanIR_Chr02g0098241 [Helianthus annuus]|nr:hypothetical protein HanIR_Chr02g0098241 [Helianthus annuus]
MTLYGGARVGVFVFFKESTITMGQKVVEEWQLVGMRSVRYRYHIGTGTVNTVTEIEEI